MKLTFSEKYLKTPSSRLSFRYCYIFLIFIIIAYLVIPVILDYGPESINTDFDIQMSFISYRTQFFLITSSILVLICGVNKFLLKDIDKWYLNKEELKYNNPDFINKIRKKCYRMPYLLFILELILPLIVLTTFLLLTGSHDRVMISKIVTFIFSFLLLLDVYSFLFAEDIYNEILKETYFKGCLLYYRFSLKLKGFMQVLPICLTCLLVTNLIAYSRAVTEKENIYFTVYSKKLTEAFTNPNITSKDIYSTLNSIQLYEKDHSKYIITPDKQIITTQGPEANDFILEYTMQISQKYDGKVYDRYGIDRQGHSLKLSTAQGTYYVGILYNVSSYDTFIFLLYSFLILLFLTGLVLYIFISSLTKKMSNITDNFNKLSNNEKIHNYELPITSNDEISDLITAFNKVQEIRNNHIEEIESKQNKLMEKERLSVLGELIGGIAHNLKTPIMSIAGSSEGLKDLVKEYDSSIGDNSVTEQDHHEIANDMDILIEKINSYTEYMSDIITTVKGQVVTFTDNDIEEFTASDLIKRVTILMNHELKKSQIILNTTNTFNNKKLIKGNINSLVQVINNMIMNSIQAYSNSTNEIINLNIKHHNNNLVIEIEDFAGGLPDEVEKKLFKKMITTKGKGGTGIGLYMSYTNIKAQFNGDITFKTKKGKGTTFYISIPL